MLSNSERNLIILQININGINYKLEELKTLIKNTHADIITIQETKLTSKSNPPKVPTYTTVRADRPHKSGGGLITLIRDNITYTPTDIPSTINTHNIELQMVKVHLNNAKHITIANVYIPPRDSTSTHYKYIHHCIQHITTIPHSVLTEDVNAHSSLWHSYTNGHRGQLIAEVISNSDHISLNTDTPTRVPNTAFQQTSSPDNTTVSNTLCNRTSWQTHHALSSDHLPIMTTIKGECSVFKKKILLWMKMIHYPNTIRSHLVTIVPIAPFTPKSTSKLRSALHIRYSKVIPRFISLANTAQT